MHVTCACVTKRVRYATSLSQSLSPCLPVCPTFVTTTARAAGALVVEMPGNRLPQRRQRHEDEESDLGSQDSKRARLTPDEEEEEENVGSVSAHRFRTHVKNYPNKYQDAEETQLLPDSYLRSPPRARDQHKPGAIVRIKVKNFVTYASAEFNCGPSLNMIIGPNGTGKSTLVCAICLGLGAKTSVLGRAKDLSEYVKHGCESAEIEIELKADPARRMKDNPIIRHVIKREGNKSTWQLDGKNTTHKEIWNFVKAFNIQIDNLCQFLPQDRVADFAKMTSIEKLEETQKAAARPEMAQWHNELKILGAERSKHITNQEQSKTHLEQLQKRQDAQRADVERMTERKNLLDKLNVLEKCRPGLEYLAAKKEHDDVKGLKRSAENELRELRTQVEPAMLGVQAKEAYSEEMKGFVESRKRTVDLADARAKQSKAAIDEFKGLIEQCEAQEQAEKDSFNKSKEKVVDVRRQLTVLRNRVNNEGPIEFNAAEFNERARAKQTEINESTNRATDIKSAMQELKVRKTPLTQQRQEINQKIISLKSQSGQQMAKLEGISRDTHRAWNWIKNNQNRFKEPILGPPMVECSVKDKRYAAAIESKMSKGDWCTFTATSKEDWNTLRQCLTGRGQDSLGLTDIHTRVADRGMDQWPRPVAPEELKQFGLNGFMIDLLDGPDRVLSMLCDSNRLHRTGVSLQESTEAQFHQLTNSSIDSWVAGENSYRIIRRQEYGHSSTSNTRIQPARFWNDAGFDTDAERRYNAEVREIEVDLGSIDDEFESLKEQLGLVQSAYKKAVEEKVSTSRLQILSRY
jgi:DNA repair ATPase RecN